VKLLLLDEADDKLRNTSWAGVSFGTENVTLSKRQNSSGRRAFALDVRCRPADTPACPSAVGRQEASGPPPEDGLPGAPGFGALGREDGALRLRVARFYHPQW
jgi:hypothetical protein